jgi:hypothetical protein
MEVVAQLVRASALPVAQLARALLLSLVREVVGSSPPGQTRTEGQGFKSLQSP